MNRIIGKSWRDSASLIVLNKRASDSLHRDRACVNYEVLLQTRPRRGSFPNSVVFPGGVHEPADSSADWLDLLRSFGYSNKDFDALHHPGDPVTLIFQPDPVKRHISLRITAIRETFEELGFLIGSRESKGSKSLWASAITDIDVKHWQKRVSENPGELLTLCKEVNCYPDIWSLHYWSNWLTPVYRTKRFDTAFFITAFEKTPPDTISSSEVVSVQWAGPIEVLEKNEKKELELYPPQVYELHRISHLNDLEKLIKFAQERSSHSTDVLFPVIVIAKDGKVQILPGDDLYPASVDYLNGINLDHKNKTVLELNKISKHLHRFEVVKGLKSLFIIQNYKPEHHINMGDKIFEALIPLTPNK